MRRMEGQVLRALSLRPVVERRPAHTQHDTETTTRAFSDYYRTTILSEETPPKAATKPQPADRMNTFSRPYALTRSK